MCVWGGCTWCSATEELTADEHNEVQLSDVIAWLNSNGCHDRCGIIRSDSK